MKLLRPVATSASLCLVLLLILCLPAMAGAASDPLAAFEALLEHDAQLSSEQKQQALTWARQALPLNADYKVGPQSLAEFYETLQGMLGVPYSWGGESMTGMDCSGFTLTALHSAGLNLPHRSLDQAEMGKAVARDELRPGDLLLFDRWDRQVKQISHVGIYIGGDLMIHGSTRFGVTLHSLNHPQYKRRYMGARRLVAPAGQGVPTIGDIRKCSAPASGDPKALGAAGSLGKASLFDQDRTDSLEDVLKY